MSEAKEDRAEDPAGESPDKEPTPIQVEVEDGEEFGGDPGADGEPPELPEDRPPQVLEALLAQAELERMTKMFVKDHQHVNCPVAGCLVHDDGTMMITFQVGPNEFESFRIASQGQDKIDDAVQKAKAKVAASSLVIADGPLPPEMTTGQPPGPQQR